MWIARDGVPGRRDDKSQLTNEDFMREVMKALHRDVGVLKYLQRCSRIVSNAAGDLAQQEFDQPATYTLALGSLLRSVWSRIDFALGIG
jgi:hypothetical protein